MGETTKQARRTPSPPPTAFERSPTTAASRRGDDDPAVEAAYFAVADAFEAYADALYDAYGEELPIDLLDSDDDS